MASSTLTIQSLEHLGSRSGSPAFRLRATNNEERNVEAAEQITRHAIHIQAHRLLIQQIIVQLHSIRPSIVQEIYERISSELQAQGGSKTQS